MKNPNSAEIVLAGLRAGDEQAWDRVHDRFASALIRLAAAPRQAARAASRPS